MIAITGAAGFIGSCLAQQLHRKGEEILLIDDFSSPSKAPNLNGLDSCKRIDRMQFLKEMHRYPISLFYHLGARTDTTEFDESVFDLLNLNYSKRIWEFCTQNRIPLVYASSAATYGGGEHGFSDDPAIIPLLQPLNPYGWSKQKFDLWVLEQQHTPPSFIGLKFFNVFGPNEFHKGRMASVVFHTYNQIRANGHMNLFQSHRPDYAHGEQSRDFIFVRDVVELLEFWGSAGRTSGIYNVGSGIARSFRDLAEAVFRAMDRDPDIRFIPTPEDIRDTYQYYTCADMAATRKAGFGNTFTSLEDAVTDYVRNYLIPGNYF
ncbi:MAG: ADP-glyceromanno-heptose 6-epimerase [Flavobacteriales bacterium]|nr:ADP-glyceromanno-heptose 6-epimerase [Flavobacteriales bacterium]